jgi:hypothetical protein
VQVLLQVRVQVLLQLQLRVVPQTCEKPWRQRDLDLLVRG